MLKVNDLKYFEKYTDKETFDKLKPYQTILEVLKTQKKNVGDILALSYKDINLTYKQLYKHCCAITPYLTNLKKGSHIAILSNNDLNFIVTSLGIMANGMVAVLIPNSLNSNEISDLLKKYDVEMLFYGNEFESIINELTYNNLTLINISSIDFLKTKYFYRKVNTTDVASIVFSRKSDGSLRGAMLMHKSMLTSAFYGTLGIKNILRQRYYSILPFTHVFGFVRNILTPLVSESSIYICSNMRRMFKEIPTVKPQIMVLVPAILEMILNVSKKFNMDLFKNELHTVIVGGAAMPEYLIFEYNKLGVDIFQGYGMTETSNLVTGNPSPLTKSASVGLIFPYQEIKIIDNELYIKGPNQMVGYYNDEVENKKMMVDGFIKTGDLGYQDEDGYLYLQGRCDDLIILTNGENVSPVKIENLVNNIDIVASSMVYNDNDTLSIDVFLRKELVSSKNITNPLEYVKENIATINKSLASFERVSKINIVENDFPKDENMKLIRKRKG